MMGEKVNLLIVDDEPANLLALEAVLDGLGQNVVRATSGAEALRRLLDADFAAVLLDVQMHGMDGFETARLIRDRPRSRHTPIIFLTAYESERFPLLEAYKLGAVDYLVKPFVAEILRAKIAFFVEYYRRTQELARAERRAAAAVVAEQQRFLFELGAATHTLDSAGEVMNVTAAMLGRHLAASRCAYAEVEADSDRFTIRHDYTDGCPSAAGDYHLSLFGPRARAAMRSASTLVICDVDQELAAGEGGEMFNAIGIKAIVCCPLVKFGRLAAMMAVHQTTPRDWTGDEVAVVETVVERCWAHIERARAERRLRESEAKFRAIVHSTPECVKLVAADGTLLDMNPAGLRMVEAEASQAVGVCVYDLIALEHRAAFQALNERVCRGEEGSLEYEIVGLHGTRRYLETHAVPLPDASGGLTQLAVTRDVTDRKRAETKLAESEERFRTLAETIPHLAWIARPDGHIFWYNRRWYEYTGTTPAEMEGWGWQAVHEPAVLPDVMARWTASIASGEPFDMVFPLKGKDGEFRPFLTLVMPLKDAAGRVVQWFGTNTDVAAQKAAEEVLREEGRRKDEFIALFAHELRNPLAPIMNAVQLLSMRRDAASVDRARQMIDRQAKQLAHIVDDLLEFSRLTHGKITLRCDRVDLAELARTVAGDEAQGFERASVTLAVETPPTPVWVSADRTRLTQALSNLLVNAQKFTPAKGRVTVAVVASGADAVLTVRDSGEGIEAELLGRLFKPFTQEDQGLARSRGGLGLGLALVKGLVELHGGTVRAESNGAGTGAVFTMSLPATDEPRAMTAATTPAALHVVPSGRRLRVLVIEDNHDAADSLQALLELRGCEVAVAYTGPDGLAAARSGQPDLVLCDIGLPGMSGYDIARELSAARRDKEPMLVALTGYGRDEDRERAQESGFDWHYVKPMDPKALENLLASVN